jgi:hypothetical protein
LWIELTPLQPVYGVSAFSNSELMCTLLPALDFNFRSQLLNPDFLTTTV